MTDRTRMPIDPALSIATDTEQRVLAAVDDAETLDNLARLVRARSENPPGQESEAAAVVAGALARVGIFAELRDVAPGRPNVVAAIGARARPSLVFNGHTDTMPAGSGWTVDPFAAIIDGDRMLGRGTADTKGGLAAMVGAIAAIHRSGVSLAGRLELHAVVDEESGATGTARAVADCLAADWAILAEPTALRVARASNGQVDMRIRFHGEAAHGSTPGEGRSAIADAARFVGLIEEANAGLADAPVHPLTGSPSVMVGTIQGGVQTSIVPAVCEVTVDRRLMPGQAAAEALTDLDRLLERLAAERPGLSVEREAFLSIPPVEVGPDVRVVRELERAIYGQTDVMDAVTGLRATSDAATYITAGIPAVVFGPGSLADAHRADEGVSLAQVRAATRILALTAVRLLA